MQLLVLSLPLYLLVSTCLLLSIPKTNLPSARYYAFQLRPNFVQWATRLHGAGPASSNQRASAVTPFMAHKKTRLFYLYYRAFLFKPKSPHKYSNTDQTMAHLGVKGREFYYFYDGTKFLCLRYRLPKLWPGAGMPALAQPTCAAPSTSVVEHHKETASVYKTTTRTNPYSSWEVHL